MASVVGTPSRAQPEAQETAPVTLATVQRQDIEEFTRGIGTVQASQSVLLRARVDGTLERIAFREGQTVHPGDLLAEIDPRPYQAALDQALARRAADQAQLTNARLDLARYAALARGQIASRQQVDTQTALLAQAAATLQGDEAAIATATLNLSFCRIAAPIEGVAGLRLVDAGNLIHASDAQGIVTIAQIQPIALVFTLPQDELPRIRDAMQAGPARVVATSSDGAASLAEGSLLTPNNTIDTQTGTIQLKAIFANADRRLWPGQFVGARLRLGTIRAALTVPPEAIQHGPDGVYVYVAKRDDSVARRTVTLGYQNATAAIVLTGLEPGEQVVASGQSRLQDGSRITIRHAS